MDFVRWIVENPLLDVLVKNNQNEDVPWPSALLRWDCGTRWLMGLMVGRIFVFRFPDEDATVG